MGYDMESHGLTRIMTVPFGAETTGVYFHPDINGYAYIQNQVQHPHPDSHWGRRGAIGYIKMKIAADVAPATGREAPPVVRVPASTLIQTHSTASKDGITVTSGEVAGMV